MQCHGKVWSLLACESTQGNILAFICVSPYNFQSLRALYNLSEQFKYCQVWRSVHWLSSTLSLYWWRNKRPWKLHKTFTAIIFFTPAFISRWPVQIIFQHFYFTRQLTFCSLPYICSSTPLWCLTREQICTAGTFQSHSAHQLQCGPHPRQRGKKHLLNLTTAIQPGAAK